MAGNDIWAPETRRQVEAVCAIIGKEGRIFCAQRGYGDWKGWWEFPGGKVEPGEGHEEALVREIREELAAEITVGELLTTVEYDYEDFHLTMHCFLCTFDSCEPVLLEHEDACWLSLEELDSLQWLPADQEVIRILRRMICHQY